MRTARRNLVPDKIWMDKPPRPVAHPPIGHPAGDSDWGVAQPKLRPTCAVGDRRMAQQHHGSNARARIHAMANRESAGGTCKKGNVTRSTGQEERPIQDERDRRIHRTRQQRLETTPSRRIADPIATG